MTNLGFVHTAKIFIVFFALSEYIADRLCPLDANNVRHEPTMETLEAFTIRDFDFYLARSYGCFIYKFLTSWKRFKEKLRFFRSCEANYPCGAGRDDNDSEDIMITVPATATDRKLVSAHGVPTLKQGSHNCTSSQQGSHKMHKQLLLPGA